MLETKKKSRNRLVGISRYISNSTAISLLSLSRYIYGLNDSLIWYVILYTLEDYNCRGTVVSCYMTSLLYRNFLVLSIFS